jgi:hypothetical protein
MVGSTLSLGRDPLKIFRVTWLAVAACLAGEPASDAAASLTIA